MPVFTPWTFSSSLLAISIYVTSSPKRPGCCLRGLSACCNSLASLVRSLEPMRRMDSAKFSSVLHMCAIACVSSPTSCMRVCVCMLIQNKCKRWHQVINKGWVSTALSVLQSTHTDKKWNKVAKPAKYIEVCFSPVVSLRLIARSP